MEKLVYCNDDQLVGTRFLTLLCLRWMGGSERRLCHMAGSLIDVPAIWTQSVVVPYVEYPYLGVLAIWHNIRLPHRFVRQAGTTPEERAGLIENVQRGGLDRRSSSLRRFKLCGEGNRC